MLFSSNDISENTVVLKLKFCV